MSGGALEYIGCRISETASEIREKLDYMQRAYAAGDWDKVVDLNREFCVKYYGDRPEYKDSKALCEGVMKRFKDAVECLERAAVYATRIEWLLSRDDGTDTFVARLDEELAKIGEVNDGSKAIEGAACTTRY